MSGQLWGTNSLGGFLYSDELSDVLRMALQPLTKYRQFCDAKDALNKGLNRGDAYHWDIVSNVATQGTVLTETSTIPSTDFTITQGTLTVQEMGNSVPYTGKLDDLSKLPVTAIVKGALKDDCRKALDLQAYNQFNSTPLRVVPSTGGSSTTAVTLTTNGTATLTNNTAMRKGHVAAIVDIMKERNIPPFIDDDYVCIGHPTTFRTLKSDLESVRQYVDRGYDIIMNGEIGRYEGVRFVEQNAVAKAGWTGAASNQAHFFGADTVAEALCVPEEIRGKIPSDYGRSRGVAWYYLGGFGLVRTQAADASVVKWDSAA